MTPKIRSLAGLALAVLILPIFLSLMACLPVPIGDPERSRIDPELSGAWLHTYAEDDELSVTLFEPYDKRTWLVHTYGLGSKDVEGCDDEEAVFGDEDAVPPREYAYWAAMFEAAPDCYEPEPAVTYKVWQTRIAGTYLMTWEPRGAFDEDFGFGTKWWYVFRVDKQGPDRVVQTIINFEHDAIKEVLDSEELEWLEDADPPYDPRELRSARRQVERVIRKNMDDEELFADEEFWLFERIRPEHYELFFEPLDDVMPKLD